MTSSFSLNARKKLYRLAFGLIISLLAMAFGHHSLALPDDRDQPIKIDADRAIRNDKAGITEFIGNATLIQGSMVIKAHNITISQSNKGISDITALGSPATFEQRPQLDQTLVTAKAKRIEYNIGSEIRNAKKNKAIRTPKKNKKIVSII